MTQHNEHTDSDDYTRGGAPSHGGPVFIPDAQPEPEPGTAAAWVERWQRLAEQERDDVALLHRRMEALEGIVRAKVQVGQIDAGRLDALEATIAALVKVLEVRLP